MTLQSNFGNHKKLDPTQKPTQMFSFKFRMQGLTKGEIEQHFSEQNFFSHFQQMFSKMFSVEKIQNIDTIKKGKRPFKSYVTLF